MSFLETSTPRPPLPEKLPPARFSWQRFERKSVPYIFLTPFLVGYLLFLVYPLIYSFDLACTENRSSAGSPLSGLQITSK